MYELPVTIERFENQFAVLRNDMTGEFKWPANNLPLDARNGDSLILTACLQKNSEKEKYSNMRVMLEELIN